MKPEDPYIQFVTYFFGLNEDEIAQIQDDATKDQISSLVDEMLQKLRVQKKVNGALSFYACISACTTKNDTHIER